MVSKFPSIRQTQSSISSQGWGIGHKPDTRTRKAVNAIKS